MPETREMAPVTIPSGQPAAAVPEEVTGQAETVEEAVAESQETEAPETGTTEEPASESAEESFFDPRTVPPELQGAYKSMQGAFTRKMQELSANRNKIAEYEALQRDPLTAIQQWAAANGYQLTRAQAAQLQQEQQGGTVADDWVPNSYAEILTKAEERALTRMRAEMEQKLGPLVQQQRKSLAERIESGLDSIDPTWREYEGEAAKLIQQVPELAKLAADNPQILYRLVVPTEVVAKRAESAAKARWAKEQEERVATARVSGKTTKKSSGAATPQPKTIEEAYEMVRAGLGRT